MQAVRHTLRRSAANPTLLLASQQAAPSRSVVWNVQRNASLKSPMAWLRESLSVNVREKSSEEELAAARKEAAVSGEGSLFDAIESGESEVEESAVAKKKATEHKYSTAHFKISHRKLNLLSRQIAGKPIDSAIVQMLFSEKRASTRIKSMLVVAKDHAVQKGLEEKKLVVVESWVTKGPRVHKRLEPRGRGHYGIRQHPDAKLHVVLKEGKTRAELMKAERARKLKRIVSAGLVREDMPIRNPAPAWAW
ncbi:universal ribosomal protein uL22 family protein [Abortiporus biennis]